MTKKEFIEKLEQFSDDAEIDFNIIYESDIEGNQESVLSRDLLNIQEWTNEPKSILVSFTGYQM